MDVRRTASLLALSLLSGLLLAGCSWRTGRSDHSTTSYICAFSCPSEPPTATPSTSEVATRSADSNRRSSYTPPWTIPNRSCPSGAFARCQSTQRSSQRCVRSIERAV